MKGNQELRACAWVCAINVQGIHCTQILSHIEVAIPLTEALFHVLSLFIAKSLLYLLHTHTYAHSSVNMQSYNVISTFVSDTNKHAFEAKHLFS